ncbi:hypothetical protein [Flavobacterium soyangense]|uniref:Zinc-finger domain-containing protein n=1 Tax=Flavobacterium soyangense TaxID=2023265 RepID=A0A930UAB6_9FLAO|nr:hypothetical protein [Flavobacterium soyangense]MBF2709596.1 hypothetical protein [Flavobacterium soyangense]
MKLMINSCEKTTQLIDKQIVSRLSFKEKIQLQLHKSICKSCDSYENQSRFIDVLINNSFKSKINKNVKMTQERKSKIIEETKKI